MKHGQTFFLIPSPAILDRCNYLTPQLFFASFLSDLSKVSQLNC
jgi:hypothetical protein